MAIENLVKLYHGGHLYRIADFFGGATLSVNREFYCTTDKSLAHEASRIHGVHSSVLEIVMLNEHYSYCVDCGIFQEREYLGVIQYDWAREVVISPGNGIRVLNESLPHEFRLIPNIRGVNRVIEEIERTKQK